jgi:hypothetical protein
MPPEQTELDLNTFDCPTWFTLWMRENSHIVSEFVDRALYLRKIGRQRYAARTIIEAMRWDTDIREVGGQFKINDHAITWLARYAMHREPSLAGLFELRKAKQI